MRDSLSPNRDERLYAVDILRWFSFLAILIFHMSFALWAALGLNTIPEQNWSGRWLEAYGRTFAFSGFSVLFLSFLLFGFRGHSYPKFSRLSFYILIFAVVWSFTVEEFPYWWDIYPYLLVCFALLAGLRATKISPLLVAVLGGTLLSIPFWQLEAILNWPLWLKTLTLGACQSRGDLGDWPLLPWIGLPIMAYGVGQLMAENRVRLSSIRPAEFLLWAVALTVSVPYLGKYYVTPLGELFGCYIFRRPPLEFWAHMIPLFTLLRISLLSQSSKWLAQNRFIQWFSRRPVNRGFFVIYFMHYPLAFAIAGGAHALDLTFSLYSLTMTCGLLLLIVENVRIPLWLRTNAK